jgi:hypothetical protein
MSCRDVPSVVLFLLGIPVLSVTSRASVFYATGSDGSGIAAPCSYTHLNTSAVSGAASATGCSSSGSSAPEGIFISGSLSTGGNPNELGVQSALEDTLNISGVPGGMGFLDLTVEIASGPVAPGVNWDFNLNVDAGIGCPVGCGFGSPSGTNVLSVHSSSAGTSYEGIVELPITSSQSNFAEVLSTVISQTGTLSAGVRLGGAVILDSNHNVIPGAVISADSGYDYATNIATPEPLVTSSTALGIFFLWLLSARKPSEPRSRS